MIHIIGEAPVPGGTREGQALHPDFSSSGRRLLDFSGLTRAEYLEKFTRYNLMPVPVTKRRPWPGVEQSRALARVESEWWKDGDSVVLLGHRVAEAFGAGEIPFFRGASPNFDWSTVAFLVPDTIGYVVPHPSGRNRWFNDPRNRDRYRAFWRGIAS